MADIDTSAAPESNHVETEAREQGWVPKEDFEGDAHRWVDAGEFIRRGELFGKIETQNKELKSIRETLAQFKDHHNKVQEAAYKKAVADLKQKKKDALRDGDADLVVEVDEQMIDVKARQAVAAQQAKEPVAQIEHPEFVNFRQNNTWYDNNKAMRAWADARGTELAQEGKSPSEVLKVVAKEVRNEFKDRFENPKRSAPGAVESSTRTGSRRGDSYEPSDIERAMAKKFVSQKMFKNENEYYAELRSLNS